MVAMLALLITTNVAQDPGAVNRDVRRGAFTTTLSERGKLQEPALVEDVRRFNLDAGKVRESLAYDIRKESFEVYVPGDYDGQPYGLFVWINSVDSGKIPEAWRPVLDKHRVIAVGANGCGNERSAQIRIALAIDAVHNIRKMYSIDADRIYLGGLSGGSHCVSDAAIDYADAIQGAFYICGAHPRVYDNPVIATAKRRSRFVFCTGSNDNVRENVLFMQKEYGRMGYSNSLLLDVPGMGHTTPDAAWFEKGVIFLDSVLVGAASGAYAQALKLEKAGDFRGALAAYQKAARHGRGQAFSADASAKAVDLSPRVDASSLETLEKLMSAKPTAQKLREFAREWGGTAGGKEARREADAIGVKELEKALEKKGAPLRIELQKLIASWDTYSTGVKSLEALDREAKGELESLEKVQPERLRHTKFLAFAKTWAPSTVAAGARVVVETEAAKALEEIKKLPTDAEKIPRLAAFAKVYDDTPQGSEARRLLEAMVMPKKK